MRSRKRYAFVPMALVLQINNNCDVYALAAPKNNE